MFRSLSPYWLWAVLSLPAAGFFAAAINSNDPEIYEQLLHPTGEFSARFMIIAMLASPLLLILKGWRGPLWLKKNRRYFGVAAFGYAALHTLFYLVDSQTMERLLDELSRFYIWTGWLAFLVFIPLAVTSMDFFRAPSWPTLENPATVDLCSGGPDLAALGRAPRLGRYRSCACPFRSAWPA
ncbi:MAG: ferric reductase-like transmembrane domain-containing protein [Litoreibacter sp.]|nr:ferric reductase-like transmembrane domain-containing protein [Litoreibacter sp.]MCY4334259.1 ferric reductase-like transmembrane domain-containing protein [Litoreibacter sp.]